MSQSVERRAFDPEFHIQFVCNVVKENRFWYLAEVGVQVHNTVAELLHVLCQQLVCIGYPVIQVSHFVVGVTSVTQSEFRKHTTYTRRLKSMRTIEFCIKKKKVGAVLKCAKFDEDTVRFWSIR